MKLIRKLFTNRFSLFDVAVAGLVAAAILSHDYWVAGFAFVIGSWLSGFLGAALKAT